MVPHQDVDCAGMRPFSTALYQPLERVRKAGNHCCSHCDEPPQCQERQKRRHPTDSRAPGCNGTSDVISSALERGAPTRTDSGLAIDRLSHVFMIDFCIKTSQKHGQRNAERKQLGCNQRPSSSPATEGLQLLSAGPMKMKPNSSGQTVRGETEYLQQGGFIRGPGKKAI